MNKSAVANKRLKIITVALFFLLTFLPLSLFPSSSYAGSWNGWIYQNSYPTSNTLLAVKFITPKKGWIAGEKGTILYTEDGGDTWEAQESGTEQDIKGIDFVDEKTGWAVGKRGAIIHTGDSGKTWASQYETNASLHKIFFVNEKIGWVVGDEGTVLHTIDSGKKWDEQDIGIKRNIASIYFTDPQTGWILAGDEVYRTKNGGKKWDKTKLDVKFPKPATIAPGGVGINMSEELGDDWRQGDLYFTDEKNGWAVVGLEYISHTEDGGKTWINQRLTSDMSELRHIAFRDTQNGCAIGSTIFCTEDGGKTWTERLKFEIDEALSLKGISFTDQATIWVVGADGTVAATGKIMKTEDGGKSWSMVSRKGECGGNAFFVNKKTGWLFGLFGNINTYICRTDDAGQTWEKQDVGMDEVGGIFFTDASTGWAVGAIEEWRDGKTGGDIGNLINLWSVIKHTTDGGKTWATQFKESMGQEGHPGLVGIFFVNPDTGWAIGQKGTILRTEDGGKNWQHQKSGDTKLQLRGIQFIDPNVGWIIGIGGNEIWLGTILYTEDGGKHWQTHSKKINGVGLQHVFFTAKKIGCVTGVTEDEETGWLLYTENAGKTWLDKEFEHTGVLYPAFLDKDRGVLVSQKGFLLITKDGGKTWTKIRKPLKKKPWHFSEIFEKGQNNK